MISIPERLGLPEESLKKSFDNFDFNLRCASPGIIMSFDSIKQTCTVQIAISEWIKCNAEEFVNKHGANVGVEEIPILEDVPVVYPIAGDYALTFPVKAGDECLVVFSDTCIDSWYQSGGVGQQMSLRRHDLSDAFAIVGVTSQPRKVSGYSTSGVQLRSLDGTHYVEITSSGLNLVFGSVKIEMSATGIVITGNVTMMNQLDVKQAVIHETTTLMSQAVTMTTTASIGGKDFAGHTHHITGDGDTEDVN